MTKFSGNSFIDIYRVADFCFSGVQRVNLRSDCPERIAVLQETVILINQFE